MKNKYIVTLYFEGKTENLGTRSHLSTTMVVAISEEEAFGMAFKKENTMGLPLLMYIVCPLNKVQKLKKEDDNVENNFNPACAIIMKLFDNDGNVSVVECYNLEIGSDYIEFTALSEQVNLNENRAVFDYNGLPYDTSVAAFSYKPANTIGYSNYKVHITDI
jgi:hypothetical protein